MGLPRFKIPEFKKRHALSGAQNRFPAVLPRLTGRFQRLVQQQPLLLIAVAAAAGVLVDSGLGGAHRGWGITWIALVAIGVLAILLRGNAVRPIASVLVFLPVAALLHRSRNESYQNATLLNVVSTSDQPTILEGVVDKPALLRPHPLAEQPQRREQSPWQTQLEVRLEQLKVGRRFQPFGGRVLVVVDGKRDELKPGDVIRVYGTMRCFSPPANPGQRDLRAIYQLRHLHARVDVDSEDQVVMVGQRSGALIRLRRSIASVAGAGRDLLLRHSSQRSGPLAVALVIGQRDFVDRRTRDLLLVTGTAHLLSVSGMHLAIIVVLASWTAALLRFPPAAKMIWILAVCVLYTAITGGRPPVMRAAVLVGTFMFAIWMKRPIQPVNTLALAALILMAVNPDFVFSVGVQLSFLAVATLVLCGQRRGPNSPAVEEAIRQEERLEALVERSRSRPVQYVRFLGRWLGQLAWFSGCVTAISTPLVWQQFHVVAPISVLTNVVLGPFLFLALAAGVVTVGGGLIYEPLAIVPGSVCNAALGVMRWLIETAAAIPFGHTWLPSPPTWWVALFYVVMVATLVMRPCRRTSWLRYGWIVLWNVVAWLLATTPPAMDKGGFEATFVNVGHGTSVVLRFAEDDVWLYDCGRLGNETGSSRDIDETLWSLGVTRVRGVFLSHADADHFNALPGVLRRFTVGAIITPPGMLDEPEAALAPVRDAIEESGVVIRELTGGDRVTTSGHTVRVLHPPAERLDGNDNANSLVLRVDCSGKSLILPGDLEPPGTESLIDTPRPPPGGVLMAPHHGSLTMNAASVLQWARPGETIVSGGQRARRPEVEQMLAAGGSRGSRHQQGWRDPSPN